MRKKLLSLFILLIIVVAVVQNIQNEFFRLDSDKVHTMSSKPVNSVKVDEHSKASSVYEKKLYELIGKDSKDVIELLGQPARIDVSEYDYDWWIYNEPLSGYCQIGIEGDKVVTAFVMGDNHNISPFKIGQPKSSLEDIVDISEKVEFQVDDNLYQFELTAEEQEMVPLIHYKNIWAQVYIDKFSERVSSIRFLDAETLVKIRPYELVYRGELISAKEIDPKMWDKIENGKAHQILDMTNVLRVRNGLSRVDWDQPTAVVAYSHSREMFEEEYFSHSSPTNGDLSARLLSGGVLFKSAGENIAARYVDAISAVEGWLNSEGHRTTLLNKDFTHLGVGVYDKYYTQNFISAW